MQTAPIPTVADIKEIGAFVIGIASKGKLNISLEESQALLQNLGRAQQMFAAIPDNAELVVPAEEEGADDVEAS